MVNGHLKVLVTGANGFVGSQLVAHLRANSRHLVRGAVRSASQDKNTDCFAVGAIDSQTDWSEALTGQDVVIHAAARVHVMQDEASDPLSAFREVNVAGTENLARQAAQSGVRRFIFLSSIKVNGEHTPLGVPFSADDRPAPKDAYGTSKLEAEDALKQVSKETGMEIVIVRPPLVYGPGVKGNFASMVKLVAKGWPLPLGATKNRRSFVALDNLIDLIVTCIDHPAAASQSFLVSDGEDLSTSELFRRVAEALNKPSRLVPVPVVLLEIGACLLGKKAIAERLLGSLEIDLSKTTTVLGWKPPISVSEGLKRCCENGGEI